MIEEKDGTEYKSNMQRVIESDLHLLIVRIARMFSVAPQQAEKIIKQIVEGWRQS